MEAEKPGLLARHAFHGEKGAHPDELNMIAQALAIRPSGTAPAQLAAYGDLLNAAFETDAFTPEGLAWR